MRAIAAAAAAMCALTNAPLALGDEPPPATLRAAEFSPYEQTEIANALARLKQTVEPNPEGKTIEGIDIVTLDVIEPTDPVPSFINVFHVTTKRYVVDREILLRPGEAYRGVAVEESVRNLRALRQLSLVVAIPTRGSTPDKVRLLVLTKDVWSLRLNWDLQAGPGGIEDFIVQPSETNFLGTHQLASLYFELDPNVMTFGVGYDGPRLQGTRNALDASAALLFNWKTGAAEGSYGGLIARQPLFSAKTKWAWDSTVAWDDEIIRRYVNAVEAGYRPSSLQGTTPPPRSIVPWEYKMRTFNVQESVTRSLGWHMKHDFTLGVTGDLLNYGPTAAIEAYDEAAVSAFLTTNVPRSDNRVGPFFLYHDYETRFARVLDFQTLGLQEDFRLGHELFFRIYPLAKAFGSSRDVLGIYAGASYTLPLGDGLVRGFVQSVTEAETSTLTDGLIAAGGEIVTPRLGIGRLVYDAQVASRYRNYLNTQVFLGGNTRLRGYPSNFFVGKDIVTSNLEFRSRPLEILHTLEVGAVAFYDAGDAANGFGNLHTVQSVGGGFRALFPQLDRFVFRADVGFPVGDGAKLPGVAPWSFFLAFQQAFALPTMTRGTVPSGAQEL